MKLNRNLAKALALIMLHCVIFALSTNTVYAQSRISVPGNCKTVQQVMNSNMHFRYITGDKLKTEKQRIVVY